MLTFAVMGLLLGIAAVYDTSPSGNSDGVEAGRNVTTDLLQQQDTSINLFQSWLQVALAVAAIVISIFIYRHKEVSDRNNLLQRSYKTLLMELEENKPALEPDAKHQRVKYPLPSSKEGDIKEVNYTNAYLDVDAYESILYSGNITHLPPETQKRIIQLYQRIKKHNEVLSWTNQFEDMFFLDGNNTTERLASWHSEVKRYEKNLTKLEMEMLPLMNSVIKDIRDSIMSEPKRRITQSDPSQ